MYKIALICVLTVMVWMVITQTHRYLMHKKKHDTDPSDSVAYKLAHSPDKIYWVVPVVFVLIAACLGIGIAGCLNEGVGIEDTSEIKDVKAKDNKAKLEADKVWEYNDCFISKEDKVFSASADPKPGTSDEVTVTKWFSTPEEYFAVLAAILSFLSYVVLDYGKRGMKGLMTKVCDCLYYEFVESNKADDKKEDKFYEKVEKQNNE